MKKNIIAIFVVILVLAPLAQLLRTQQPWNCFQLTFDESFFTQAAYNLSNGRGYRQHVDAKPFSAKITAGFPFAWGVAAVHRLGRVDWPQAGRIWVHLNFIALLLLIALWAKRRGGTWASGVVAAGLFGWFVSRAPSGPYLTYGVLAEIPAALVAWLALALMNTRYQAASGAVAALSYIIKPTFAPLGFAISVASIVYRRARGLAALAAFIAVVGMYLLSVSFARGVGVLQYLGEIRAETSWISAGGSLVYTFNFFKSCSVVTLMVSLAAVVAGIWAVYAAFKKTGRIKCIMPAQSDAAGWLFFMSGIAYYFLLRRQPQPKHWFVFYNVAAGFVSIHVAVYVGRWLSKMLGEGAITAAAAAVCLTWLLIVPGTGRRAFVNAPNNSCPVKEQRHVDRMMSFLVASGQAHPGDIAAVTEFSSSYFMYETPFQPSYYSSWDKTPRPLPKWVAGDLQTISAWPRECAPAWRGSYLMVLKCGG